ncbi:IS200/IS605 family transposase, partial [Streptomyces sp. NPDC005070]
DRSMAARHHHRRRTAALAAVAALVVLPAAVGWPKIALSKLVNSLKGVSSRYLRAEYTNRIGTGSVFWSPSYFAGSCGGAPLSIVKEYIENQKRPA